MSDVTTAPVSEGDSSRTRETGPAPRKPQRPPLWERLEHALLVRVLAVLVPVGVAGILLAPRLATRVYPTSPDLVGTPVNENIKAPYDVTIEDTDTTERLRTEAEAKVPSVYDFDVNVGTDEARHVSEAFAAARKRLDILYEHSPELVELERMGRAARVRAEALLDQTFDELKPEVEKLLAHELAPESYALLKRQQFDKRIETALRDLLIDAGAQPFVELSSALAPERERGISVQRVPNAGGKETFIEKPETILDRDALRLRLTADMSKRLADLSEADKAALAGLATQLLRPSLTPNRAATEVARQLARLSVKPVTMTVKKGEMVIRDGERFTSHHLLILSALGRGHGGTATVFIVLGGALVVLVLFATTFGVARPRLWENRLRTRDMAFLAALFVLSLLVTRLWLVLAVEVQEALSKVPIEVFLFIIPVSAGAMIARLCLKAELALIFAALTSMVLGLMVEAQRGFIFFAMVGAVLGVTALKNLGRRSDLLRAGLWVGVGQTAMAVSLLVFDTQVRPAAYLMAVPAAFVSGLIAAVVALAMTPVVEAVFDYTTNLELLELANLNHPALKELIVQAPGSYHHSVIVGSLVEAAAEEIGANPLLARVMAYYHDIGKCRNPSYFSENQRDGQNPHDKLKPSMSAMILKRHVSDGLDIAREYRLGEEIMAGIGQHHGTTLIHFFFQKAKEGEDESNPVSESDYRYDFRKPQTREAALVMLGDAVEAAATSLPDPTPARLIGVVSRIINLKFSDGQLDECDLTLKDLHKIAKAFGHVLGSIYHDRPTYPGLLGDVGGKKPNADLDPKPPKRGEGTNLPAETDGEENLKRLGLDGR